MKSAEVYYSQANEFYKNNQYEKAIIAYNKAIEINPNYADVYYNKGIVLKKLGQFE